MLQLDQKSWVARVEAEKRLAPDGLKWGEAIFRGRLTNIYFSPGLIKTFFTWPISHALPKYGRCQIADFACDTGFVARTVARQLGQSHRRRVDLVGIDIYGRGLQVMKQRSRRARTVQGDLKELGKLPIEPKSFHAGIFRFALPFIPKDAQPKVFEGIYNLMKEGSVLVVMSYGALGIEEAEAYNKLFNAGTASWGRRTLEEVNANMHMPSFARVKEMAERAGFSVRPIVDLTHKAFGYLSPEIYGGLYELNDNQLRKLTKVFEEEKQRGILPFEPNTLRVLRPMYTCLLTK